MNKKQSEQIEEIKKYVYQLEVERDELKELLGLAVKNVSILRGELKKARERIEWEITKRDAAIKTMEMAGAERDVYKAMLEHRGIDPKTGEQAIRCKTKTRVEQDEYDSMLKKHRAAMEEDAKSGKD